MFSREDKINFLLDVQAGKISIKNTVLTHFSDEQLRNLDIHQLIIHMTYVKTFPTEEKYLDNILKIIADEINSHATGSKRNQ